MLREKGDSVSMITVKIIEDKGLTALCTITGDEDEFREDLAVIKSIPFQDRDFVSNVEPKYWRVRNAEMYASLVDDIRVAIDIHKRQLRMSI